MNPMPIPYKRADHLFRSIIIGHIPVYLRCHVGALEFVMEVSANMLSHYHLVFRATRSKPPCALVEAYILTNWSTIWLKIVSSKKSRRTNKLLGEKPLFQELILVKMTFHMRFLTWKIKMIKAL